MLMRGTIKQRIRLERSWKNIVAVFAALDSIPRAEGKRRVRLVVTPGRGCRGADPDAYFKATGDALVACGLLKGDSKEWVEWSPVEYRKAEDSGTMIMLEDL